MKPTIDDYPSYYKKYIELVEEGNIINILQDNFSIQEAFLKTIAEEKGDFRYETNKWSIKELLLHIVDTERIMAYRALRFSRKDKTSLVGFDENTYAPNANAANRTIQDIIEEWKSVRQSTIQLFKHCTSEMLAQKGIASEQSVSVNSLAYIIAGHALHHIEVLKERYI